MQRDIAAGRPPELDAIPGAVLRAAEMAAPTRIGRYGNPYAVAEWSRPPGVASE